MEANRDEGRERWRSLESVKEADTDKPLYLCKGRHVASRPEGSKGPGEEERRINKRTGENEERDKGSDSHLEEEKERRIDKRKGEKEEYKGSVSHLEGEEKERRINKRTGENEERERNKQPLSHLEATKQGKGTQNTARLTPQTTEGLTHRQSTQGKGLSKDSRVNSTTENGGRGLVKDSDTTPALVEGYKGLSKGLAKDSSHLGRGSVGEEVKEEEEGKVKEHKGLQRNNNNNNNNNNNSSRILVLSSAPPPPLPEPPDPPKG
ncbi:hypothetical protein E2C01_089031 [Portunus trituberculatus]|uniref:Uncharacterized protein n=1 Tax=Portunus trituberculatus TaxID=210409 RepID=A0A5B7JI08_PORTR|nr:hypothetical protein [Portunus trituberculatus]